MKRSGRFDLRGLLGNTLYRRRCSECFGECKHVFSGPCTVVARKKKQKHAFCLHLKIIPELGTLGRSWLPCHSNTLSSCSFLGPYRKGLSTILAHASPQRNRSHGNPCKLHYTISPYDHPSDVPFRQPKIPSSQGQEVICRRAFWGMQKS